ncbi:hypothetical protein ACROYT_G015115 [Oculina patagonica]
MAAPGITKQAMFRSFVYVDALLGAAQIKKVYDELTEVGEVKKVEFSQKTTAAEMKASGQCHKRLKMNVVVKGLASHQQYILTDFA